MKNSKYDVVIGLEVHVQLASRTKIFCGCPTAFGAEPNSQVCPVCAGYPGVLPVLNRHVFQLGLRAAVGLNGEVARRVKFDRKNYFYPDLPKGYQISQYDMPVCGKGFVEITTPEGEKKVGITRAHLEEDAGKLIHDAEASYVDLNRAGVPLLEIVSEPVIKTPDEAYAYLTAVKALMKCLGVSEVNMEKGHLRCDANISLRKSFKDPFGTKVEIKNLNSFKFVRAALAYEIKRQASVLDEGGTITHETRLWDDPSGQTRVMRAKEEAHDYRYFPEPDLVPFEVTATEIQKIRKELPPLPKERRLNFKNKYGLTDYDTGLLLQDDDLAGEFERLASSYDRYKTLANWLIGPLLAYMNEKRASVAELDFSREEFLKLIRLVDEGRISFKAAKDEVFIDFMSTGRAPETIMREKNLTQISDKGELDRVVAAVVEQNAKSVNDFRSGKTQALSFLVGQVMRQTKGKANPNLVNQMIREKIQT